MKELFKSTGLKKVFVGLLSLSMLVTMTPVKGGNEVGNSDIVRAEEITADTTSEITIDGNNVRADNVNGLTYKGFGFLSANSTSDLLLDYKAQNPEAYAELMQYLFGGKKPLMTHIKLEMGNDRNNSTGAEASVKRAANRKTNILRNSGWQIAADAFKINPNLKVSILRWNYPKWAKAPRNQYIWYRDAIMQAYEKYGYMVSYINPCANEKWDEEEDPENVIRFNRFVSEETAENIPDEEALNLFKKMKFICSDQAENLSESIAKRIVDQDDFAKAVSVIGYHYRNADNTGLLKQISDDLDYEIWCSENQATFSDTTYRPLSGTGIGGVGSALEMGNFIVKGFTESRRSHIVYQPVVASFYEGGQYSYKELVGARDPWSGWMRYDAGLYVLEHLSKFAVTGWENEDNTAGIWRAVAESSDCKETGERNVDGQTGGDSYLTLAAPDKTDFSTMFVNNSSLTKEYKITLKNLNPSHDTLEVWETRACDEGNYDENYMKLRETLEKDSNGVYSVVVMPYSVVTVTSLENKNESDLTTKFPSDTERTVLDTDETGDVMDVSSNYLYADDFEYEGKKVPVLDAEGKLSGEYEDFKESRGGDTGFIARYTNNLNGAFEGVKKSDGNYVLRQMLDSSVEGTGSAWNDGDAMTVIGDYRWTNYRVSADVLFEETENESPYAAIAMRQTTSEKTNKFSGYSFKITKDGEWSLLRNGKTLVLGAISTDLVFKTGFWVWNNISIEGKGSVINAYVNNNLVASYDDANPITFGRIGLASAYSYTEFDNLKVTKLNGYAPYFTEVVDNMETFDLTQDQNEKLVYNDKWSHQCGQGMFVNQRSCSYSTGEGASVSYKFMGTGFDIFGYLDKNEKKLKITVDGEVLNDNYSVTSCDNFQTNVSVTGLEYGEHEFTVEDLTGNYTIDAIGIYGAKYEDEEEVLLPVEYREDTSTKDDSDIVEEIPSETTEPETPSESETPTTTPAPSATTPVATTPVPTKSLATTPAVTTQTQAPATANNFSVSGAKYTVLSATDLTVSFSGLDSSSTAKSVVIPATITGTDGKTYKVTEVAAMAFKGNKKLKKVVIGANVKVIGKKAFFGCTSLKNIIIKSKVLTTVGAGAIKKINKKAVIKCPKAKKKAYKKLFKKKTGFVKTMKIK